ncbi:hypothetical protein [Caldicellulosiruptor saccharolyticus]|nr:hypothetical protein [Caldicellulosiruptor saccharolyticus]
MNVKPRYYYDEEKNAFCIENYQIAKPFSSFLPGIAGIYGIPLWCFYVNRGQCIASFGIKNKDGSILEFMPADRAYRLTSTHGFRTFLKIDKDIFYEPFKVGNLKNNAKTKMIICPSSLEISELHTEYGLEIDIKYYTLPNQNLAGLIREVTIRNNSSHPIELKLLDGLPLIVPYGKNDFALKNMSRTIEAWNYVENLENKAPYFRLHSSAEDTTEVVEIKEGNFFVSFKAGEKGLLERQQVIIDPKLVFGVTSEVDVPYEFIYSDKIDTSTQIYTNKTCCAFGFTQDVINAGDELKLYTIIGHAKSLAQLNGFISKINHAEFFEKSFLENKQTIDEIVNSGTILTSDWKLNEYSKMCYLDNILRGGWAHTVEHSSKKNVIYLFSRKHGDLERDYNFFEIQDTYYSQGNGNFRDINQNRRNDLYFNPYIFDFNVWYFMNLIQLDSYNPLVVKGIKYRLNDFSAVDGFINTGKEKLKKFFEKDYLPYELVKALEDEDITLNISSQEFINACIVNSEKLIEADPGEGFWIDHFTYNFDLIENFESIYPDKMKDLLLQKKYFYYDNEHYVRPRAERVKIINGKVKQFGAYALSKEKKDLIESRDFKKRYVRTNCGKGDIYYTSLFEKLLVIILNRISTLDPFGVGIEMEASKPGWNDALNGLPGIFGSSSCETMELLRLVKMLKRYINSYLADVEHIEIFEELYQFLISLRELLENTLDLDDEKTDFKYWDVSNEIKEKYRETVMFGINGKTVAVKMEEVAEFLNLCERKLSRAVEKAFDPEKGLYCTYFINEPTEYEIVDELGRCGQVIRINKFSQKRVAFFLESQVRALKVIEDKEVKKNIYHSVKNSNLYDKKLGMYKTNESLEKEPNQLGRIKAFTPGWLENESIFMHMEFKYLLEILKSRLYEEFFEDFRKVLPPFMDPEVYGRSIFENSSFIASSSNPDESIHGTGFVARLSGTTTEFLNMLTIMAFGDKLFEYIDGQLVFRLAPKLPSWMFTTKKEEVELYVDGKKQKILVDENSFLAVLFGRTIVIYKNPKRLNTYDHNTKISKYILHFEDEKLEVEREVIEEPISRRIRNCECKKIEVIF